MSTSQAFHPRLRIYIPHLGRPRHDRADDPDWPFWIGELSGQANVMLGVSALAHFSRPPFPHDDLRLLAEAAIERFGPERLVAATDYPLIDKQHYSDTYHLARKWITDRWPEWNDDNALRS